MEKKKIAVFWSASCGGCDVSLLDIETHLLELTELAPGVTAESVALELFERMERSSANLRVEGPVEARVGDRQALRFEASCRKEDEDLRTMGALVVDREREIQAFVPVEYWSIEADLAKDEQPFVSRLVSYRGEKVEQFSFENETAAREVERTLLDAAKGETGG